MNVVDRSSGNSSTPVNPGRALAVAVAEAIRGLRAGDRGAMDDLVREVRPWLYRIAVGHRLDHHSAEDVVQETLLSLVQHVHELRDPAAGLGWLSVVARHEAVQVIKKGRRVELPGELAERDTPVAPDDPERCAIESITRDRLAEVVEKLPERCGNVLRLAFLADERDYSAISTTLGMPVGSIGPTRQRALRKMRDLMSADRSWEFDVPA
jgi:RNA polymerase sigma factor (sigma-70 family)